MPTPEFHRWAAGFDHRRRFGIPVLPIRKAAQVPPSIVVLPPRAGSMKFDEETVTAVIDLLKQCEPGQAVKLTDDADEKENASRRRAEVMKEQIESRPGGTAIREGFKLRGHVLTEGEPEVRKISGKNYKFFPKNWAAISLVPDTTNNTPAADAPPADPPAPGAPADPSPASPPAASTGRGRKS